MKTTTTIDPSGQVTFVMEAVTEIDKLILQAITGREKAAKVGRSTTASGQRGLVISLPETEEKSVDIPNAE